MQLNDVTLEDGRACANLINLLKAGRWDLSGNEAEQLVQVKKWVHRLAVQMAEKLKNTDKPAAPELPIGAPTAGFRIKSRGTMGTKSSKKKK